MGGDGGLFAAPGWKTPYEDAVLCQLFQGHKCFIKQREILKDTGEYKRFGRRLARADSASVQTYARFAGVLLLTGLVVGSFGELIVPSTLIVSADATATAHNILASQSLFRMGFAGYIVEAACDVSTTLLLYVLLRPVNGNLALLAAFFGLLSTATFAIAEFFYFAALHLVGGAPYLKTFSPDQLNTLALLSLKMYGYGGELFMALGGVGFILLGYLIFRSDYFPKTLGVLLALGVSDSSL
jgi:hypothetical protein